MKAFFLTLVLLCCMVLKTNAQGATCPPPNIGFEQGDFSGWACDTGHIDLEGVLHLTPTAPIGDRQTLYNRNSFTKIDTFGNFPTLCPYGGKYSIRLGNRSAG